MNIQLPKFEPQTQVDFVVIGAGAAGGAGRGGSSGSGGGGNAGSQMSSLKPRRISISSRWPSLVINPVVAPVRRIKSRCAIAWPKATAFLRSAGSAIVSADPMTPIFVFITNVSSVKTRTIHETTPKKAPKPDPLRVFGGSSYRRPNIKRIIAQ